MMYLCYNIYVCVIITLLHISGCNGNSRSAQRSVRVTYTPKRFRLYETSVTLTFRFGGNKKQENSTSQVIKVKVFNRKFFVTEINKTFRSFGNEVQLEISCEVFAAPGKYHIKYFIQGLTRAFISLTQRPITVRSERVHIEVQKNHTSFDGSVSAWLNSKQGRCKPFRGILKLYWIKNSKESVLVTSKKVVRDKLENRTRVHFRCNTFDTEGTFYLVYFSEYNNKTISRSHNISVSWGKYKLTAQSKNIFPCTNSFVIKFSSPYCDNTEDEIEMKARAYTKIINTQTAFHGFRSVFFPCAVFKKHIREYCFHYITKSSLTKERKIQATLCIPSTKRESTRWIELSEWSPWGTCTSPTKCGKGRKYRYRFCPPTNPQCTKKHKVEFAPCALPPCKDKICKSCGCVFSTTGGTIVSSKFLLPSLTKELSSCHWFIKIAQGMKMKLWFDSLKLARNSSVVIRDGNSSTSEILKRLTYESQRPIKDIYSGTSNIISIWYSNNGVLDRNVNNTGFLLSYASVDKFPPELSVSRSSESPDVAKMTFIGILAILIVVTFTVIGNIIVRVRRQKSQEDAAKTALSQRPSSSQTSTASMSESTMRSLYEPQLSADESVNYNSNFSRINNNHRLHTPTRIEHRTPVHVCPRCCPPVEHCPSECNSGCHQDGRRILYRDAYCGPNVENTLSRGQRVHSIIERRLSEASLASEEDFPHRNFPKYL